MSYYDEVDYAMATLDAEEKANGVNAVLGECWRDARQEVSSPREEVFCYVVNCDGNYYFDICSHNNEYWADRDNEIISCIAWRPLPDPPSFA